MAPKRFHLLGRLRRAISKVKFLLSFELRRWFRSPDAGGGRQQFRLENRPGSSSGLLDCALPRTMSRAMSGMSAASDDIDQRAEDFIERFSSS
ncbi:hypothetical protein AXF42_Ash016647 [Apostasia shenzhenica]|uniref:Uncharacterized protein n=1 Tax=Apostasia shenzhenica TaxID=1088818 RepID=A0A2I0A1P7_9ASPA|nr:hypothetical protein AXF42_Ash016647 [Apostasia shenzhenica]